MRLGHHGARRRQQCVRRICCCWLAVFRMEKKQAGFVHDTQQRETRRSRLESCLSMSALVAARFTPARAHPHPRNLRHFHGGIAAIAQTAGYRVTDVTPTSIADEQQLLAKAIELTRAMARPARSQARSVADRQRREPSNPLMEAILNQGTLTFRSPMARRTSWRIKGCSPWQEHTEKQRLHHAGLDSRGRRPRPGFLIGASRRIWNIRKVRK